ncbi:MAG: 50S ribosomal protein L25 [Acidobacteria bacterium]|nr:50S ribosomal protein L25 [Acidobacteriota bacterium]
MTATMKKQDIVIEVERREGIGKEAAGKLRRQGKIPGVVYGGGVSPFAITVDRHSIQELLKQESGGNTIFLLKLKGGKQERRTMIREIQIDPMTRDFIHVDFIRVTKGHALNVTVPLELDGDCVGIRHGGVADFVTREVEMEVLPREIPDKIVVDISNVDVDELITLGDITGLFPPSARLLSDPNAVVVRVMIPRVARPEVEEEEETIITEQAEPEIIGAKGGKEEGAE